ncbi:hypothetical protein U4E84_06140 [Halorubrum sp. AD140]|uniref:hypothetical protein n=1 Tax=Halorubrum sp. AD140 TaxID=3050073 RepID=UPI002ACCB891|nr:hypothetical protein [Halorubrum sp. AD140]MDZ5810922.1 hypothetical protein [Halorubrum sp. AD140]
MPPQASDVVDQLSRVDEIGFPEFTHKLISDTFDATVSSMIRQQEAYAELLEQVVTSIEQFESDNVTPLEIDAWIQSNAPMEDDESTIGTPDDPGELESEAAERLESKLAGPMEELEVSSIPSGSLDESDVHQIRMLVRRKISRPRQEALEELVEQGIVRIVLDEGTIETRLKFEAEGRETDEVTEREYDRTRTGVSGSGRLLTSILGVGVGGGYQNIDVSTRRERRESEVEVEGEIFGRVELNLRGDYQPLRTPESEPEEGESEIPPQ